MAVVTTRSGKGSPLTHAELDANFNNLNAAKAEKDANGRLTANGIIFPATAVPSTDPNTIDDYEEGVFTPTVIGSTAAGTATYTARVGRYTKIGNRVFFTIHLDWTGHTGTGNLRISDLPFTVGGVSVGSPPCSVFASNLTFSGQLTAIAVFNTVQIYVRSMASGVAFSEVAIDSAALLYLSGHYEV